MFLRRLIFLRPGETHMINVALNPSQHLYILYVFEQMFSLIQLETVKKNIWTKISKTCETMIRLCQFLYEYNRISEEIHYSTNVHVFCFSFKIFLIGRQLHDV